jgi:hypothetical protein
MHPGFTADVFKEAQKISNEKFMSTMGSGGVFGDKISGKTVGDENEFETKLRLKQENPLLPRPFVLRAASGRYTRDMPVEIDLDHSVRLDEFTPSNFDEMVNQAPASQLIVCLCYRADEQAHVWADQLMQYALGTIAEASVRANGGKSMQWYWFFVCFF